MHLAAKILSIGMLIWFALLGALLVMRMLRRGITISGMLAANKSSTSLAPERILHIAAFPAVLAYFVFASLNVDIATAVAQNARPSLPDIPQELLALLTGANSLLLAGKIARGP